MTLPHDCDRYHLIARSVLIAPKLLEAPSRENNREYDPGSDAGSRLPFPYGTGKGGSNGEQDGCGYLEDDPDDIGISKPISQRNIIRSRSVWYEN